MKVYGKTNIFSGNISSNVSEESDTPQNILAIDKLSELDTSTIDPEMSIIDLDTHTLNTVNSNDDGVFNPIIDGDNLNFRHVSLYAGNLDRRLFDNINDNYLSISKELFDFGPIGSPIDFVIDFNMVRSSAQNGTILYNGQNTGAVDLDQNKNFLLTTSGVTLIKDPNYGDTPSINQQYPDGYLYLRRPHLRSIIEIVSTQIYHVAIIRSGDITYLAINGKIQDSAPSVDYFFYDIIKMGTGYYGANGSYIWNFRVKKNTDRGWTADFDPPNHNHVLDGDDFLLDSYNLTDKAENYTITVHGIEPYLDLTWSIPLFISRTDYIEYDITNSTSRELHIILPIVDAGVGKSITFNLNSSYTYFNINSNDQYINVAESTKSYRTLRLKWGTRYPTTQPIRLRFIENGWVQWFADGDEHINIPNGTNYNHYNDLYSYLTIYPNPYERAMVTYDGVVKVNSTTNVKYIEDGICKNRLLPILDLTTSPDLIHSSSDINCDSGYSLDLIMRFTGNPSSDKPLLYTPRQVYNTDYDLGLHVTDDRRIFTRYARYYRDYKLCNYTNYCTGYDYIYSYSIDSSQSFQFELDKWYRILINNDTYSGEPDILFKTYVSIQDLHTGQMLLTNSLMCNSSYDYYYHDFYDSPSGHYYDYHIYRWNYVHSYIPRIINGSLPIQIAMCRIRNGNVTNSSETIPYFNTIGEFNECFN